MTEVLRLTQVAVTQVVVTQVVVTQVVVTQEGVTLLHPGMRNAWRPLQALTIPGVC